MFKAIMQAIKNLTSPFNKAGAKKSAEEIEKFGQKLLKAVQDNNLAKVKHILKICPESKKARGEYFSYSAMTWASGRGYTDIVKELIAVGADINDDDENGGCAVKYAAGNNRIETLKVLINAGAKLDKRNNDGYTALIGAASSGHIEVVKILLAAGADIKITNKYGSTALKSAESQERKECVELLKAAERETRPTCEEVDILPPKMRFISREVYWQSYITAASNEKNSGMNIEQQKLVNFH